jgi:hypothetical protein
MGLTLRGYEVTLYCAVRSVRLSELWKGSNTTRTLVQYHVTTNQARAGAVTGAFYNQVMDHVTTSRYIAAI